MIDTNKNPMLWAIFFALLGLSVLLFQSGCLVIFKPTALITAVLFSWLALYRILVWTVALSRKRPIDVLLAVTACALLGFGFYKYVLGGFSFLFLKCWLGGIASLLVLFWRNSQKSDLFVWPPRRGDIACVSAIALFFGILYLAFPSRYPLQMNTDEIVIRDVVLQYCFPRYEVNPLGPSPYAGFPTLVHLVLGWTAQLIGGVSIDHLRTAHAFFGLLAVIFSFVFFRTLKLPRKMALLATCILGFNHTFISIARLVSQNMTSPLFELISFALLYRGITTGSKFLTFAGGITIGVTYYCHPPARIVIFIFLLAYFFARWSFSKWRACLKELYPLFLGFALVTAPMLWGMHVAPAEYFTYQRAQFLLSPEGRKVEQVQFGTDTEMDGIVLNIQRGLLAFNYPIEDGSNIYTNVGSGIVDPITGVMIWVGLLYLLIEWKEREQRRFADLICMTGFLSLWLVFSFFITFAPSYTRLTIALPFVAYLAAHGFLASSIAIRYFANELPSSWRKLVARLDESGNLKLEGIWIGSLMLGVIILNVLSMWTFTQSFAIEGDRVGNTFRLAESLKKDSRWRFFMSADEDKYQYFTWGAPGEWEGWMDWEEMKDRVFVVAPQKLKAELKSKYLTAPDQAPFVLFLNYRLWAEIRGDIARRHPDYTVENILSDGRLLAVIVEK